MACDLLLDPPLTNRFYKNMNRIISGYPGNSRSSRHAPRAAVCRGQKTGFTVTEVLVAMLLAVLAVSSAYKLLTHSRNTLRSSANRLEALNTARAGLEYLRTLKFNDSKLDIASHTITRNGDTFDYEVALYDSNANIKQITVKADWVSAASGSTKQLELVTLISSPLH